MLRTPLLLIFLFSCSRTIDIDISQVQKLVVHGYVAVGDRFNITVSRTIDTQIPDTQLYIRNAWATLYEDDIFIDSLLYNAPEKKYIARQATAEFGKTYTIKVGAPTYPTAEATAKATVPVPTISLSHNKNARLNENGEFLDDVQFSFQDPAGMKNYYLASLHSNAHNYYNIFCVYSADPAIDRQQADVLPTGNGNCINPNFILFNDQSFNGALKKITVSVWPRAMQTTTDLSGNVYKPYLKRYVISEAFYKYLKNINSQDFEVGLPYLNVPATDVGNVTNGYGLFTLFSVVTDSLP